ncbi:hotdog fold thioesterase [Pueribacillus sp. YX66]|uniref:hotdog fold thioesterase n=1 Tax=Pueribacillus sp. YX66 TaxID=3229242 RepID=UPI00358D9907
MIISNDILERFGAKNEEEFAEQIKQQNENTLLAQLDMEYVELTPDRVVMTMPVGPKTWQPAGILHGGASVALAETAATIATAINIDQSKYNPVGMEINANHIRSKADGVVTATATPFHKGRTTMVWDIKITDENGKLICISRCTMAVIVKR